LKNGYFANDKSLKGKHKGKFRKRAGNYRIIYLKENNLLLITVIRIADRKEIMPTRPRIDMVDCYQKAIKNAKSGN